MNNIKISYENDTDLADYEAFNKGYRGDVIVEIEEKRYKVYISSMIRLQQDFQTENEKSGYYMVEPNTIIVNEVTKQEIETIITNLYECDYFSKLDSNGF